jgi:very-short-patch-repair endonuclease
MRDHASLKHAQAMRKEMPEPELRMWLELRAARFRGIKFRRQKVIGKFIADFASNQPKLAIELDGDTHGGHERHDAMRTRLLEQQGYTVVRFSNSDVMENMDGVLEGLGEIVDMLVTPLSPTPSPEGEGAML